jgi:hypothetical protein
VVSRAKIAVSARVRVVGAGRGPTLRTAKPAAANPCAAAQPPARAHMPRSGHQDRNDPGLFQRSCFQPAVLLC